MIIHWLDAYAFREQMSPKDKARFDQLRDKNSVEGLTADEEQEIEAINRRAQRNVHDPRRLKRELTVEELMAEIDNLPNE
jgi:hypothetical protein